MASLSGNIFSACVVLQRSNQLPRYFCHMLSNNSDGKTDCYEEGNTVKLHYISALQVDRETLTSPVAINIIADDGSSAVTCTTTYTVTDENDNLPLFSPVVNYVASVVESVARGSAVALLQIDDKDDPAMGNSQVADGQLVLQTITGGQKQPIIVQLYTFQLCLDFFKSRHLNELSRFKKITDSYNRSMEL